MTRLPGIFALALALTLSTAPAFAANRHFVGRKGTQFTLDGQPFRVAGTHVPYLAWGSRAEVDKALTDAAAMNFNVVRFFNAGIIGSLDGKAVPTVWGWPLAADSANMKMNGVHTVYWNEKTGGIAFNDGESGFERLDYAIKKAGDLGLHLNIAFLDFWQYAGGSQQIRAWYGSLGNLGQTGIQPPSGGDPQERYTFSPPLAATRKSATRFSFKTSGPRLTIRPWSATSSKGATPSLGDSTRTNPPFSPGTS